MIFIIKKTIIQCSAACFFKIQVRSKSWNILFFGNDDFSLFSLKTLHRCLQAGEVVNKLDVVTTFSTKPNPVSRFATENNLLIRPWPPIPESLKTFDVGVVVSFGYLIPKKIIDAFPLGMINVHASLLPRWRGASPIIHAIMMGDTETGISIMRIKPHHFDTGDVIIQKKCLIGKDELMPSVHCKLGEIGASSLIESISTLPGCLEHSIKQCDSLVTYAPRIKPEICILSWTTQTAEQIYNLYRALYGFLVLRSSWHGQQIKIREIRRGTDSNDITEVPGRVRWTHSSQELKIHCKTGSIIIEQLNIGGKRLKSIDFYNGYLSKRPREQWFFS